MAETTNHRAVGYVRVSSTNADDQGLSGDAQEQLIRDWAAGSGVELVGVHRDEGISGANGVDTREALPAALDALRDGDADTLVIVRLDRLARVLTVQEAILAAAWATGARVVEVKGGEVRQDDPDDPMRTAMRQMAGVFAQLERATVVARLRAGKRAKRARGGYAGGATVPLGVRVVDREFVEDADEAATVARIHELHGEGRSLRAIAAMLTDEGRATKQGRSWHASTVGRVLARG